MKNKELISKQHENKPKVLYTMNVNNEKAIEVNVDLKTNADEQHLDMNYLKEKYEIDDEDEDEVQ